MMPWCSPRWQDQSSKEWFCRPPSQTHSGPCNPHASSHSPLPQARMVAAATNNLCEAANAAVQGHASEEKLISSAKQVAASTAQLLVACKVKADQDSEAMKRLQVSCLRALGSPGVGGEKKPSAPGVTGCGGAGCSRPAATAGLAGKAATTLRPITFGFSRGL